MDPSPSISRVGQDSDAVALARFRQLIQGSENIVCPIEDDIYLLRFIRAKKYNLELAVKQLRQYSLMRRNNPELFESLTPLALSSALRKRLQVVLKRRDAAGRQIFIFRAGNWNPNETNMDEIFQCNYLYLEEMTSTEETQLNGVTAIVDFSGFSFLHVRNFTPKHAIRMVQVIQGCYPCRFQQFHLVNQPYLFQLVYAMVKPFLSAKIKARIHIHGNDLSQLHELVSPDILPDFLGGSVLDWEAEWEEFLTQMFNRNEYYEDLCQLQAEANTASSKQLF